MENQLSLFEGAARFAQDKRTVQAAKATADRPTLENNALVSYMQEKQEAAKREKEEWLKQRAEDRQAFDHHLSILRDLISDMGRETEITVSESYTTVFVKTQHSVIRLGIEGIDTARLRAEAVCKVFNAAVRTLGCEVR